MLIVVKILSQIRTIVSAPICDWGLSCADFTPHLIRRGKNLPIPREYHHKRHSHSSLGNYRNRYIIKEEEEDMMGQNPSHLSSFPWLMAPRIPPHRGAKSCPQINTIHLDDCTMSHQLSLVAKCCSIILS